MDGIQSVTHSGSPDVLLPYKSSFFLISVPFPFGRRTVVHGSTFVSFTVLDCLFKVTFRGS